MRQLTLATVWGGSRACMLMMLGLVLCWLCLPTALAQMEVEQEETTREMVEREQWKPLLTYAKIIRKTGVKDILLSKRVALAHFRLKQYYQAIDDYERVLRERHDDAAAKEMLYYGYLYTGQNKPLLLHMKNFTPRDRVFYKAPKLGALDMIYLEGGAAITSNIDQHKNQNILLSQPPPPGAPPPLNPAKLLGSQNLTGNFFYGQILFRFNPHERVSLMFGYSALAVERFGRMGASVWRGVPGTPYFQPQDSFSVYRERPLQHQLYLAAPVQLTRRWQITPFLNFIQLNYQTNTPVSRFDTLVAGPNDPQVQKIVYSWTATTNREYGFLAGISTSAQLRQFCFTAGASFGKINSEYQTQLNAGVTWAPFGNPTLLVGLELRYLHENSENNIIVQPNLSARLHKYVTLTALATYGNLSNSHEQNGSLVYNTVDRSVYRIGTGLVLPVHNRLNIFLVYQFRQLQTPYYSNYNFSDVATRYVDYQTHLISLGFQIKPL